MFTEINNWLKNIFSNEETITFTVLLTVSLLLLIFLGEILTPFLISLIFAYLLVGLQTRLENYGMPHWPALIITFVSAASENLNSVPYPSKPVLVVSKRFTLS